ncbi:MAG TPA: RsmB/NOP family class I SAM-dependent RNA methyltransferase, partial [Chitinophagaceae bacterium]
ILSLFNGEVPFASFIKKYFTGHKKFGSRDRKKIANLCYCYFRASSPFNGGISEPLIPDELQLLKPLFLCSTEPNEILASLKPEWNDKVKLSINEKLSFLTGRQADLHYQFSSVFPWKEELSGGMEHEKFCASFLVQPDLFLRIRPGSADKVLLKLNEAAVHYEFISPFTIRLPNSFKADEYFGLDKEIVVQDYNSQQIAGFIPVRPGRSDRVWDCCAGSGGKSIMAYDLNPGINLFVSDIRESILANLKKRFAAAGIKNYKSFIVDLSYSPFTIHHSPFDLIIADVPCTGSGTWGRTPDQLFYFDTRKIDEYAAMQKNIVSNVIRHLRPGGYLLYSTCSVFKKENEEMVEFIKEKFHLQLMKMELLKGYDKKADTMFAALLSLPVRQAGLPDQ